MTNVKKNFIYNMIYQLLILIIPLITAPYLARMLGTEGIGIYAYTYSITYYFMLFVLLGINNYGNRTIAKNKNDLKVLSKTFFEIYCLQVISGCVMLTIYLVYVFWFNIEYRTYALIEIMFIISAIFDVNWLYFGLEDFKTTVIRNTVVKIITVILIFSLVKGKNDLGKYILIMSIMTLLSQVLLFVLIPKRIEVKSLKDVEIKNVAKHIKPNLVLFIPIVAVSLYKIMDKIMLGMFANVVEVGYYENAEKIINVPLIIISAMGTVMLPRMSSLVQLGDNELIKEYIKKSMLFVLFLSFGMTFGLWAIGYNFSLIYFGKEYEKTGIIIELLATTIPFISFANVIRTQFLIPKEKDEIFVKSTFIGAISNLILNLILIPKYQSFGACIGTITSEILVTIYQIYRVRGELDIGEYILKSLAFMVKAFIMFIVVYAISFFVSNKIIMLLAQIMLGCIVYSLLNYRYIFEIINIKSLRRNIC